MRRSTGIGPARDCPHEPDNAQHGQHEKSEWDQPHEEHASHHPWTHHAPPAISVIVVTSTAYKARAKHQDQDCKDGYDGYQGPICAFHMLFLWLKVLFIITQTPVAPLREDDRSRRKRSRRDQPFVHRLGKPLF